MSSPSMTPRHSRQSTIDFSPQGPRHSQSSSFQDPSTPTHHLHPSFGNSDGLDVFSSGGMVSGGGGGGGGGGMSGLGNLADELAGAFSDGEDDEDDLESDEYYEDGEGTEVHMDGAAPPDISLSEAAGNGVAGSGTGGAHNGVDAPSAAGSSGQRTRGASLSVPAGSGGHGGRGRHGHHKRSDSAYDGSEYGSDSDLDTPGMPPGLVAKMDAVESLVRRGTEDNGGPTDGVCRRLIEELRDLGSQANVEGGASRLITAHSALTTHLAHQTRQLHALAFPLFSPLSPLSTMGWQGGQPVADDETDDEADDDTLSLMLTALVDQMPRPSTAAHQSLAALHGLTGDLVATLNYLSDTLHMARQTTTTATRRLRSARELVAEMRRDDELREEGERWLARGNWDERLRRRECANVCGEVVGGFEEVCNGWRARLLAQAEQA